ncbi:hypothetical protein GAMM_110028 [Gammaproteobacteria bacterium]
MCSEPVKTEAPKSSGWKAYTYDIGCSILSRFKSKFWQATVETVGYGKIPKVPGVIDYVSKVDSVKKVTGMLKDVGVDHLIGIDVEKIATNQITLSDKDVRTFALTFAGNFVFDLLTPDKVAKWWKEKRAEFVSTLGDISSNLANTYANKFIEWSEHKEQEAQEAVEPEQLEHPPKDPEPESDLSACMHYMYGEFRGAISDAAQRFSDTVGPTLGRIKRRVTDAVTGPAVGLFNICIGAVANNVALSCLVDIGTKALTWQYAIAIMIALKAASFVSDVAKDSAKKFQFLQVKTYLENLAMQDPKIADELKKISEDPEYATALIRQYLLETIKEVSGDKVLYHEQIEKFIEEIISRGFAAQKEKGEVVSQDVDPNTPRPVNLVG